MRTFGWRVIFARRGMLNDFLLSVDLIARDLNTGILAMRRHMRVRPRQFPLEIVRNIPRLDARAAGIAAKSNRGRTPPRISGNCWYDLNSLDVRRRAEVAATDR